jgi:thioredoxin 1
MAVITLNETNFESEVNQSNTPVLVGFGSTDNIDGVSKHMSGELKCCKINVGSSPGLASRYGIRSVPTMLLFRGGQVTDTIVGSLKTEQLLKILS